MGALTLGPPQSQDLDFSFDRKFSLTDIRVAEILHARTECKIIALVTDRDIFFRKQLVMMLTGMSLAPRAGHVQSPA